MQVSHPLLGRSLVILKHLGLKHITLVSKFTFSHHQVLQKCTYNNNHNHHPMPQLKWFGSTWYQAWIPRQWWLAGFNSYITALLFHVHLIFVSHLSTSCCHLMWWKHLLWFQFDFKSYFFYNFNMILHPIAIHCLFLGHMQKLFRLYFCTNGWGVHRRLCINSNCILAKKIARTCKTSYAKF